MSIFIECDDFCLTSKEVESLATVTYEAQDCESQSIALKCVSEEEIKRLNKEYREKDSVTNVLTFSYGDGDHDVALCVAVAEKEADERKMAVRDYVALLLVHSFLHVYGMDHERSKEESKRMEEKEKSILKKAGFKVSKL